MDDLWAQQSYSATVGTVAFSDVRSLSAPASICHKIHVQRPHAVSSQIQRKRSSQLGNAVIENVCDVCVAFAISKHV